MIRKSLSGIALFLCLFLSAISSRAQNPTPKVCGTPFAEAYIKTKYPRYEADRQNLETQMQQWIQINGNARQSSVRTIPVVVHVVYNNSTENIPDAQILSQIDVLNEDFRRLNADTTNTRSIFKPVAADAQIEFCLAKRDPNGNSTTGITRTATTNGAFTTNNAMKANSTGGEDPWPRDQYLNIWVCLLSNGVLGYALLPPAPAATDGVVIDYRAFGRIGNLLSGYQEGRSCTHEVGHYLGLYHTFDDNGNCAGTTASTCATNGDRCCDTPADSDASFGCPSNQNSCTDSPVDYPDQIENFMDYSYGDCRNMFSQDQVARMNAALSTYRSSLYASNNLACVPVNSQPTADFEANITQVCPGNQVQFTDLSLGNPSQWSWSFPGGTPSSSTLQNPVVTYNSAGTYNVTLTSTNGFGSDTKVISAYITVGSGGTAALFSENFESGSFATNGWTVSNPDNDITWEISSVSGNTPGNNAARVNCYNYNNPGQRDGLLSPSLDFSSNSNISLSFEHAYRRYSSSYSDSLIIYVSTNGGNTFPYRVFAKAENGTGNFATNTILGSEFTPSSADDWCFSGSVGASCFTVDLSQFDGSSNVKLKFEVYDDYGNNLYIDNIKVTGNCSSPNQPPVADFQANFTTITVGNSVNFTDLSSGSPTSWSWSFSGGSPGSSSTQNPSGITYNTPGTYDVSLTATNTNGSDTELKQGYITVLPQGSGGSCDTLSNIGVNDTLALYTNTGGGYVCGHNSFGDLSKTDSFYTSTPGATVDGVIYLFGVAKYSSASSKILARVWSDNNGKPGSVLASENVLISDIAQDVTNQSTTYVQFTNPVSVNGPFYVGISLIYANGDTVALFSNLDGNTVPTTAWEQFSDATWHSFDEQFSWGLNISQAIFPIVCHPASCPAVSINTIPNNTSCGLNNGSVTVSAAGGTTPYTYAWSNGSNGSFVNGLSSGTYSVTATDANGCTGTKTVNIGGSTAVSVSTSNNVNATCNTSNGSVTATVSNGTAPVSYVWSNGANTATNSGLAAGSYSVTVTDANGCSASTSVTITSTSGPSVTAGSITDVTCNGESDGGASVSVTGGATPYSYLWSNNETSNAISNVSAGTYSVTVYDGNQCSATTSLTVNEPVALSININTTNASCGNSDGGAAASVSNGSSPYTYNWSTGGTGSSISNVGAGNYSVTVSDANGCQAVKSFNVNNNNAPTLTVTGTDVTCNGGNDGTLTANYSGGSGPYTVVWSNSASSGTVSNLSAGTYGVTVTDDNSCAATTSGTVNEPSALTVSVSGTAGFCGNNNGAAFASASGGSSPYIYSWNNGSSGANISGLGNGTFTVTVTDDHGCTATGSVSMNTPSGITAVNINTTDPDCGQSNGSAVAVVTGGSQPFSFTWSNGGDKVSINNLSGGSYTVTVTDANGCSKTATTTLNSSNAPSLTLSKTDVSCKGDNDGTISAAASGGATPFSYSLNGGAFQNNNQFTGLQPGTYTITVKSANGCSATKSITVSEPNNLIVNASSTPANLGASDGTASVSAIGGTPPYSFSWSNGDTGSSISGLLAGTYTVTITDDHQCQVVEEVSVGVIGGVEDRPQIRAIQIFPNPNKGQFTLFIDFRQLPQFDLTIYNVIGQEIYSRADVRGHELKTIEVSLKNQPEGVYILKAQSKDTSIVERFMIQR